MKWPRNNRTGGVRALFYEVPRTGERDRKRDIMGGWGGACEGLGRTRSYCLVGKELLSIVMKKFPLRTAVTVA